MKIDKTKFKHLLLEKRVTQKDIAKEFNVSGSVVSSWFSRGIIPDQYIYSLNKLLNENIVEYFEDSAHFADKPAKTIKKQGDCSHFLQRIADLEANLKDKQVIIDLLMLQAQSLRQHAEKE